VNEQQRERREKLRVGIFVLIGLLAFLGAIYALGARARLFEAKHTIHAQFTEVAGLTPGATVRLAGVQIGRVTGVHLPAEPGGRVRVDLSIARRYFDRIRTNSVARIDTQGLLGDKLIEITVGSAEAPPVEPGGRILARDPYDVGTMLSEGAQTVKNVATLADSLRQAAESFQESQVLEEFAETGREARRLTGEVGRELTATATNARRLTERLDAMLAEAETGKGWARTLLYDEPVALRRLEELLARTQTVLDRVERGEGAIGVLTSAQSTAAARAALDDFSLAARNLRDVTDRVVGGRGALGSLVRDEADAPGLQAAMQDLQAAMANLRVITDRVREGEGTLGALLDDPAVYERLVEVLEGTQRSSLFRIFLRGLTGSDAPRDGR
jgi:phospholipid/cholesterol/gamma-HCH transport system substrate-binding protein